MKKLSVGLIYTNGINLLLCHSTGNNFYDIPKGLNENNENNFMTCKREIKEEINLDINIKDLINLGQFKYTKEKDLYLFMLFKKDLKNINEFKCTSYFIDKYGKNQLEVDRFKYVNFNEIEKYCTKNMFKVLNYVKNIIIKELIEK